MSQENLYVNEEGQLVVKSKQGIFKFYPGEISHLSCMSHWTSIHLKNMPTVEVPILLKHFEAVLSGFGFLYANRYTLVNLQFVVQLKNGSESKAVLIGGTTIDIARRRYKNFRDAFEPPQK